MNFLTFAQSVFLEEKLFLPPGDELQFTSLCFSSSIVRDSAMNFPLQQRRAFRFSLCLDLRREPWPAHCGILLERAAGSFYRQGSSSSVQRQGCGMPSATSAARHLCSFTSGLVLSSSCFPCLLKSEK